MKKICIEVLSYENRYVCLCCQVEHVSKKEAFACEWENIYRDLCPTFQYWPNEDICHNLIFLPSQEAFHTFIFAQSSPTIHPLFEGDGWYEYSFSFGEFGSVVKMTRVEWCNFLANIIPENLRHEPYYQTKFGQ